MRRIVSTGLFAAVVACSAAGGVSGSESGVTTAVNRLPVERLSAEKAQLEKEVELLKARVESLSQALALAQSQAVSAALEAAVTGKESGAVSGVLTETGHGNARIVDVNRDLRMVALGAGYAEGIRAGMVFAVRRDGEVIARIRVVDVRERISGAVVDEVKANLFPQKEDHVVGIADQDSGRMGQWKR